MPLDLSLSNESAAGLLTVVLVTTLLRRMQRRSFTDYSAPSAGRVRSLQFGRSPFGFATTGLWAYSDHHGLAIEAQRP